MHHPRRRTLTAFLSSLLLVLGIVLAPVTAHSTEISSEPPQEQACLDLDGLWNLILEWLGLDATSDSSLTDTTPTETTPDEETSPIEPVLDGFDPLTTGDGTGDGTGDDGDNNAGLDPEG